MSEKKELTTLRLFSPLRAGLYIRDGWGVSDSPVELTGAVQDSENRLARMDFKIAVELSKLCHVIAYTHDVDADALSRLHGKCLDEVRRINGAIDFENAYKYQKRET